MYSNKIASAIKRFKKFWIHWENLNQSKYENYSVPRGVIQWKSCNTLSIYKYRGDAGGRLTIEQTRRKKLNYASITISPTKSKFRNILVANQLQAFIRFHPFSAPCFNLLVSTQLFVCLTHTVRQLMHNVMKIIKNRF